MFGTITIEAFVAVNCVCGCIFCTELHQFWQTKHVDDQKHLVKHRIIVLFCCILICLMSLCGYMDIINQVDTIGFDTISQLFYLFQVWILCLIFYSYWHFGQTIGITYYRIVHSNNDILPKKWNQWWKAIIVIILSLYLILLLIYYIAMHTLFLLWSFFLIFDIFLFISQIISFQMMQTIGRPIKIYLQTVSNKQRQIKQLEQSLVADTQKKIKDKRVENTDQLQTSNNSSDSASRVDLQSNNPKQLEMIKSDRQSEQPSMVHKLRNQNGNINAKIVGIATQSSSISTEILRGDSIGNSKSISNNNNCNYNMKISIDPLTVKDKIVKTRLSIKPIDWNKIMLMKRELRQFSLIGLINLFTICIVILSGIDLLGFEMLGMINYTIISSNVSYLTQFGIIFCILIQCIIYLWYFGDNSGINTSFHLSAKLVHNKWFHRSKTSSKDSKVSKHRSDTEKQSGDRQNTAAAPQTEFTTQIKFHSADAVMETEYGFDIDTSSVNTTTRTTTGVDSAGINKQDKKIVIERATGKYGRKKVPRTYMTDESKQAALDYYFEHSSVHNAKPYKIDLKKQLSSTKINMTNTASNALSPTVTLLSGINTQAIKNDSDNDDDGDEYGAFPDTIKISEQNDRDESQFDGLKATGTVGNSNSNSINNNIVPVAVSDEDKISIVIYEFDNVFGTLANKLDTIQNGLQQIENFEQFDQFNENNNDNDAIFEDVRYYDLEKLELLLGGKERIDTIKEHLNRMKEKASSKSRFFIFSKNRPSMFVTIILETIGLLEPWFLSIVNIGYGNTCLPHIFGCNHTQMVSNNHKSHLLLLHLMNIFHKQHDSVLYIGNDKESIENIQQINPCHLYHVKTNGMLVKDMKQIEKML